MLISVDNFVNQNERKLLKHKHSFKFIELTPGKIG